MFKTKLCSLAMVGMLGFIGLTPIATYAAETNTKSSTLSDTKHVNDKKSGLKDKLKKANEKWGTLSDTQKSEIYTLLEEELKIEEKLLDKLVELGVMENDDVTMIKSFMLEKYNKVKESGEFPLFRQKGK